MAAVAKDVEFTGVKPEVIGVARLVLGVTDA